MVAKRSRWLVCVLLALASQAQAHGMRTAYLEVVESAPGFALATLKLTVADDRLGVRPPDGCTLTPTGSSDPAHVRSFALRCNGALTSRLIRLEGLGPVISEAVVRVSLTDGTVASSVLTAAHAAWTVPPRDSSFRVAAQYVRLGVAHILTGADHLLFLLGLLLHARKWRLIVVSETAFTLSHSASFTATALGWLRVSSPAAEACIALSLVLIALDAGRRTEAEEWHLPALALVFGLVHGLGFAGGLAEVGLPDTAIATALVGFGMGVEVGQIAFLAAVFAALRLLAGWRHLPRLTVGACYGIGTVGCYWLLQRLSICLG
jgi:hydrogenase/urease accessory protein HupE